MTDSSDGHASEAAEDLHAAQQGGEGGDGGAHRRAGNERLWRELLELDSRMFKQRGIRLLTPEARVLFFLTVAGSEPVTSVMQMAGTSYRGFYGVIERLKQAGLVSTSKDAQDQRVRRLTVDPSLNIPPVKS